MCNSGTYASSFIWHAFYLAYTDAKLYLLKMLTNEIYKITLYKFRNACNHLLVNILLYYIDIDIQIDLTTN